MSARHKRVHKLKLKGTLLDQYLEEHWADLRHRVETKTIKFICVKCLSAEQANRETRMCHGCAQRTTT